MFWLANSWMTWKKSDGSDYEPDSLTSFHRGIARYLQTIVYEYDIVKSSVFHKARKCLKWDVGSWNRPGMAAAQIMRSHWVTSRRTVWADRATGHWQRGDGAKYPVVFCHQTARVKEFSRGQAVAMGWSKFAWRWEHWVFGIYWAWDQNTHWKQWSQTLCP